MKKINLIVAFSFIMILISCSTKKDSAAPANIIPTAILVEDMQEYSKSAIVTILSASIERNIMAVNVSYSGGCKKHNFKLIGSVNIQKSLPPKRAIKLFHDNNDDSCRELVEETLKFDISAFKYPDGEIILNLEDYAVPLHYTSE